MRECPNCATALVPFEFGGVQLDECPDCAGIWFDADELKRVHAVLPDAWAELEAQVVPRASAAAPGAQERGPKACPVCRVPMHPYRFLMDSEIWLDECARCCGHWVDEGELAKMEALLAQRHPVEEELPDEALEPVSHAAAGASPSHDRRRAVGAFIQAMIRPLPRKE